MRKVSFGMFDMFMLTDTVFFALAVLQLLTRLTCHLVSWQVCLSKVTLTRFAVSLACLACLTNSSGHSRPPGMFGMFQEMLLSCAAAVSYAHVRYMSIDTYMYTYDT